MNVKEYTVVLMRPSQFDPDERAEPDFYVSIGALGDTVECAIEYARRKALRADGSPRGTVAEDYALVVIFEGNHEPVRCWFQDAGRVRT